MRSNVAKKQDIYKEEYAAEPPKQFLKLVAKQEMEYEEMEGSDQEVDYEEFLGQYGIKSEFA